jgi:hypothetical protein
MYDRALPERGAEVGLNTLADDAVFGAMAFGFAPFVLIPVTLLLNWLRDHGKPVTCVA